MAGTALHDTIKHIVETSDFEPLFDHLAGDVVFKVTIPRGTPISGEFRGKQAVIDHFTNIGEIATFRQEQPLEFLSNGDRIVVLGDDSFTVKKSGVTARSEYALVFDVRDGLITRFIIIQDLSAFVDAYRRTEVRPITGKRFHRLFQSRATPPMRLGCATPWARPRRGRGPCFGMVGT